MLSNDRRTTKLNFKQATAHSENGIEPHDDSNRNASCVTWYHPKKNEIHDSAYLPLGGTAVSEHQRVELDLARDRIVLLPLVALRGDAADQRSKNEAQDEANVLCDRARRIVILIRTLRRLPDAHTESTEQPHSKSGKEYSEQTL